MNKRSIIFLLLFVVVFVKCSIKTYDQSNRETQILGHRANGIQGFNDSIMDNTLPAVIKAIQIADGVEVDIQMSQDGTIWLYHDTKLVKTDSSVNYIPNLNDRDVLQWLNNLHPNTNFTSLEQLFSYFYANKITKYISLDIKSFYQDKIFKSKQALQEYMLSLAEKVISLSKKYELEEQVLIESDIKFLLDYFEENSDLNTFLLGFGNFNNQIKIAAKNQYTGLSHNFQDPEIDSMSISHAYREGLLIQLWTPNSKQDLMYVINLHPDFIQTDHIPYFKDKTIED